MGLATSGAKQAARAHLRRDPTGSNGPKVLPRRHQRAALNSLLAGKML
jgi:hypothetical protein